MPNKIITIQLQSVEYGGDNLGNDIRLDLTVNGASTVIRGAIDHGATRAFWKALYRFQSTNNTVRIPVSATVSEEDIVYNDVGSASGSLTVDLNGGPNQTLQSLKIKAIGSGGDKGDIGVFTLNFAAKLEDVYRFVPDVSHGWLRVRMEPSGTIESLSYTVALSYVKTERRREYFTILEGTHAGKSASVSLNDDGTSRFLTTDPRSRAVRLRFTKSTGVLEVVGTASRYQTTTDRRNPVHNGEWDIDIPDFPHDLGRYYENRAQRAKTWFYLGHSGDRYLHTGRRSAGCVTVTEVERWDELYAQIIGARKGDGVSVGVLEVR